MAREHRENYRVTATDDTQRALASVRRGFEQVEGAVHGVQRATVGLVGIAAAAAGVRQFLTAASEAEQASNRLAAVLRATGHAAGMTKKELDGMAESMADSTMFDDEAIRNAQSTLLKFGVIQGEVFERGMKAAADYASFTGGEIEDAAQTIGKALQSPEEGIGALERQIGKLDTTQKQNIKTFMDQGNIIGAQNLVLDILQKKIGGTSDLMNTGLTKSLKDVSKNFGEFSEAVGKSAPADSFLGFVNQSLKDMKAIIESGDWVAALKFILGFRGMDIKASGGNSVSGYIKGGPLDPEVLKKAAELQVKIDAQREAAARRAAAAKGGKSGGGAQGMSFDELMSRGAMKRLQMEDQASQDAEAAAARLAQENQRLRESVIDLIDPSAQYVKLLGTYREAMELGIISTEEFTEASFLLQEKIEDINNANKDLEKDVKKTGDAGREFGLTMSSALGKLITEGGEARDVIRALGKDLLQMYVQKEILNPAAGFLGAGLGALFGGGGGGAVADSFAGGGFTGSGSRSGGLDGQGGFMAMLHPNETVIDHALGGGGGGATVVQNIHFSANTPAAVRDAVFAMMPQIRQQTVAAVQDQRNRTGDRR